MTRVARRFLVLSLALLYLACRPTTRSSRSSDQIRALFGSLILERPDGGDDPGWILPLELLQSLRQAVRSRPEVGK